MIIDDALWAGAWFTILGALIGALATLVAARYTWRRQHFNEAAAHFRAAFVDTIYALRGGKMDVFLILTDSELADQERAMIRFEQFLTPAERVRLDAAWTQYSAGPHTDSPGSLDKRPGDIARTQANIQAVLKCAMPR